LFLSRGRGGGRPGLILQIESATKNYSINIVMTELISNIF
jgi:hypothetical protein